MNIFILEDSTYRIQRMKDDLFFHTLTITTSVEQAKAEFRPPYDLLLLDHDLGGDIMVPEDHINTGSEFVRWLIDLYQNCQPHELPCRKAFIHSLNFGAADSMASHLENLGMDAAPFPFGPTLLQVVKKMQAPEDGALKE